MHTNTAPSAVVPESGQPLQDEWGVFDPRRAGVPAVLQAVRGDRPLAVETIAPPSDAARATHCAFCSEPLSPTSKYCSRCLRETGGRHGETPQPPAGATPAPGKASSTAGALYSLESPARCPQCEEEIRTFRVLRVLRTQVSFTSTLPRKGYVIVCPECERVISAELSGLI